MRRFSVEVVVASPRTPGRRHRWPRDTRNASDPRARPVRCMSSIPVSIGTDTHGRARQAHPRLGRSWRSTPVRDSSAPSASLSARPRALTCRRTARPTGLWSVPPPDCAGSGVGSGAGTGAGSECRNRLGSGVGSGVRVGAPGASSLPFPGTAATRVGPRSAPRDPGPPVPRPCRANRDRLTLRENVPICGPKARAAPPAERAGQCAFQVGGAHPGSG